MFDSTRSSTTWHGYDGLRLGSKPRNYKLGAWHDVGWWQLELHDRHGKRAPPLTPKRAEAHPQDWAAAFAAGQRMLK